MVAAPDLTPDPQPVPQPVVLYDGVCGLCHRAIKLLLHIDAQGSLRYAPLQGETAARLRRQFPQIPVDLDTVVVVDEDRVYLRAHAAMRAARYGRMPWRLLWWFRWVPRWLADPFYILVAKVRYRIFGKVDACALPNPQQRERFLP